jgi:translation elongation factor EF-Tu-like GTPase
MRYVGHHAARLGRSDHELADRSAGSWITGYAFSLQLLPARWIRVDNGRMTARWRLTVEESFSIRGRGTVVVGALTGTGHNEAAVVTTPAGQSFHIAQVVFDVPRASKRGEIRFGVFLGAIDHKQLKPGTIVQPLAP